MNERSAQEWVDQMSAQYTVSGEFLDEIGPMIDEILAGEFSEYEKKYLLKLVEDAFRRQAEIEQEKRVKDLALDHLSHQIVEKQKSLQGLGVGGRMDDPTNRISPGRDPHWYKKLRFGQEPFQN